MIDLSKMMRHATMHETPVEKTLAPIERVIPRWHEVYRIQALRRNWHGHCKVIARSCGICKVVSSLFGILARPFLARPLRTKDSADGHNRGEADLRRRRRETCLPLVRSHKGESRRNQRRTQSSVIVISAVPRRVHTSSVVSAEIGM